MYPPLLAVLATPGQQQIDAHARDESAASVPTQLAAGSALAAARGPCSGSHGRALEPALAEADKRQAGLEADWLEMESWDPVPAARAVDSAQLASRTSSRTVRPPGLTSPEPGMRQRGTGKRWRVHGRPCCPCIYVHCMCCCTTQEVVTCSLE